MRIRAFVPAIIGAVLVVFMAVLALLYLSVPGLLPPPPRLALVTRADCHSGAGGLSMEADVVVSGGRVGDGQGFGIGGTG